MKKIFIIANGSNDLYHTINKNILQVEEVIKSMEDIEFYVFYKLINCDPLNLWQKYGEEKQYINEVKSYKYILGELKEINNDEFFRDEEIDGIIQKIMAPDLFLAKYVKNDDDNIVILIGHGGPFQAFLDMDLSPSTSLNTINLCKRINQFNIKLLFLDMCAMNYIEILYELLNEGNIDGIITYKDIAPFDGIDYKIVIKQFITDGKNKIDKAFLDSMGNSPLIYIHRDKVEDMNYIRELQCKLAKKILVEKDPKIDYEADLLKVGIKHLVIQNSLSEKRMSSPINYMKYLLRDLKERDLYKGYSYARDNFWQFMVTGTMKKYNGYVPEAIKLEKSSIENIIYLHNSYLKQEIIDSKVEQFIKYRNEDKYYNEKDVSQ